VLKTSRIGFTLAEVLLAGFLIAIITLALIGLALSLLRGTQKASDTSVAQVAAEEILSRLIYDVQPGGVANTSFWGNPTFSRPGSYRMNRTDFSYQIDATSVGDTSGAAVGSGATHNRLKQVQLNVYWWDSDQQVSGRQGYGKLDYHVVRLVAEGAAR
jgi:Tfp pilus assembly protein PilV